MLKDSKGNKPPDIKISEDVWKQMQQHIRKGILRQLKAVRHMQKVDKDIAAGLYVYPVEEFGKLLLLRNAALLNGKRRVIYEKEFVNHKKKFEEAFDYFRKNGLATCLVLARDCFNAPKTASDDVLVALAADTDARLSIFYADFVYDHDNNPVVESFPEAGPKDLQRAIEQLEIATKGLPMTEGET